MSIDRRAARSRAQRRGAEVGRQALPARTSSPVAVVLVLQPWSLSAKTCQVVSDTREQRGDEMIEQRCAEVE